MKRLVPVLLLALGGLAAAHDGNAAHNRNDEAIAGLTEQLKDDPENTKLLRDRSFAYFQQDEYEASLGDLDHLLRRDPKYEPGHCLRALVRLRLSDPRAAVDELDPLCAAKTTLAAAWFVRGEARHLLADDAGALADLDHGVELVPHKFPHGRVVRARVRAASGDKVGAKADLDVVLEDDRLNREALLERALLDAGSAQAKQDMETLLAIPLARDDPTILAAEARFQLQLKSSSALDTYGKALQVFDREVTASRSAHRKALLLVEDARLRGDFNDVFPALETLERALPLAPDRVDLHRLRVHLLERADGIKPDVIESAKKKLSEIERTHGSVAPVGSR